MLAPERNAAAFAISGLLLLLGALLALLWARRSAGAGVVLVGPCDAGKTTLFLRVQDEARPHQTVSSMRENRAALRVVARPSPGLKPVARSVTLTEVPGHQRLRGLARAHLQTATRVIFLVDAVNFMGVKSETADALYEVLAACASRRRGGLALLLACNKADQGAQAHTVDFIRRRLEKEVQVLRGTGSARLGAEEGRPGPEAVPSRTEHFTFEGFSSATGIPSRFLALSAASGDLSEVKGFMVS